MKHAPTSKNPKRSPRERSGNRSVNKTKKKTETVKSKRAEKIASSRQKKRPHSSKKNKRSAAENPRKKIKKEKSFSVKKSKKVRDNDGGPKYRTKRSSIKDEKINQESLTKYKLKREENKRVWRQFSRKGREDRKTKRSKKWTTLKHKGPVFPPPYQTLPKSVNFYYDNNPVKLSPLTEEIASFYAQMLDTEYTKKEIFNRNFFSDWKQNMTRREKDIIKDLGCCDFREIAEYYKQRAEERKNMTKDEKLEIKKAEEQLKARHGFCIVDDHKQAVDRFKIEPPGLFRARGDHPKMGLLKCRILPEDVTINVGKETRKPAAPPGHDWKAVIHDDTVSWLASWKENIFGLPKYMALSPSSRLKAENDLKKYEIARKLKDYVERIREEYTADFESEDMKVKQRAVALYFIDKLALRAGNRKDGATADTVGCCSLRVQHITLEEEKDEVYSIVTLDFPGKDCIRYFKSMPVERIVFENLKIFIEDKSPEDKLFDRLTTQFLNSYLNTFMEGLTAKVFRTYNASITFQERLKMLTKDEMSVQEKIQVYQKANHAAALLCNHQRAIPKGFTGSMQLLKKRIDDKKSQIHDLTKKLTETKEATNEGGAKDRTSHNKTKERHARLNQQLKSLEVQYKIREENKGIALGTTKLNYLDPRISVAWCKKWHVPVGKIFSKSQRDKFQWAIETTSPEYVF